MFLMDGSPLGLDLMLLYHSSILDLGLCIFNLKSQSENLSYKFQPLQKDIEKF